MDRTDQNQKTLYLHEVFSHEDAILKSLHEAAKQEGVERMQISPYEAQILRFLVEISKPKKVVEIGTLYAYSTLNIARALAPDGQIWTLDLSVKRHQISQQLLKKATHFKKIQWISGTALNSLKKIETEGPFDMVFIDADKAGYKDYLLWSEKNLKAGGLLIADNSFLFGAVYGRPKRKQQEETTNMIKEFNKRLSSSDCWKGTLIPTNEGLTVGIRQKRKTSEDHQ